MSKHSVFKFSDRWYCMCASCHFTVSLVTWRQTFDQLEGHVRHEHEQVAVPAVVS